ncbi:MAG TPA: PAS domain-containing sensor histidine kinase [Usitatibacter sp.]|nr:PAS domain-containing sensor histidine kinase [Usitatibacter sp.]
MREEQSPEQASDRAAAARGELPAARLLLVFFPFIAVGIVTAAVAVIAALVGWHREEMLLTAGGIGLALAVPTIVFLYRARSEREDTQRALENVRARVGGIVESAMDAIITVDEAQRIVQFNAAAEKVFRWPRQAILGQRLEVLIPERYREAHRRHLERFGETAVTSRSMGAQMVLRGLRANGEEFPIDASISQHVEDGHKLFTVILRDITERVRAEEMLARSEARLRGILDSAMDAIITVDERQHVVLFNHAAEIVFQCPRDQAVGAPLAWFIPERYRSEHGAHVQRFGRTGASSRRMGGAARVVMGLRRNGEEFPIEASISQTTEEGQRFFTVILRDVTERAKNEEALRHSREELRQFAVAANSVREQEKSRIARELHDELGQALTALKIDVGWLKERLASQGGEVAMKLASMQVLLDGTVAAARRISADLRPLMLDDLGLVAACDWLVNNFTQRTGIECELTMGGGELDLPDPYATAIFRVLQESLTNVAKHAHATHVEATLQREGDTITLSVRDNGKGFSPDDPRKPNSYGLLGLRERAYLLGGDARIHSAPGKGTTIELELHVDEDKVAA